MPCFPLPSVVQYTHIYGRIRPAKPVRKICLAIGLLPVSTERNIEK